MKLFNPVTAGLNLTENIKAVITALAKDGCGSSN